MLLKYFICAAIFNLLPVYVFTKNVSRKKSSDDSVPCYKGWLNFGDKCYKLGGRTGKLTWDEAEARCIKYGGHLVSIHSAEELDFISSFLDIEDGLWIGLNDRVIESQYTWSDGSKFNFPNWADKEPSGIKHGNEDCVEMWFHKLVEGKGSWNDVACNRKFAYICQTNTIHPTIPKYPTKGSCPKSPIGWIDLGGEFCYFIETKQKLSWYEADFDCKRRGGNLLSIHSKEENDVLHSYIKYTEQKLFIGLFRLLADENVFVWSDGSDLDYENWAAGQPNDEDEECAVIYTLDDAWHDYSCTSRFGYICSVRKISPNTAALGTTPSTDRISVTALIFISVSILLVMILLGVAAFFFYRWKMERRKHSSTVHFSRPLSSTNSELYGAEESTIKYEDLGYQTLQ